MVGEAEVVGKNVARSSGDVQLLHDTRHQHNFARPHFARAPEHGPVSMLSLLTEGIVLLKPFGCRRDPLLEHAFISFHRVEIVTSRFSQLRCLTL